MSKYLICGTSGYAAKSDDGISWTPISTGASTNLYSVARGVDRFVIGGLGVSVVVHDSGTITTVNQGSRSLFSTKFFGGKFWSATNTGDVIWSIDGISWTAINVTSTTLSIAGDDSGNIIVGCASGVFKESSNGGASFATYSYDSYSLWITLVNKGRMFFSSMGGGWAGIRYKDLSSGSWITATGGATGGASGAVSIAAHGGTLVTYSGTKAVTNAYSYSADNGTTWNTVSDPLGSTISQEIIWDGTRFLTVAKNGKVLALTTAGGAWSVLSSPTGVWLYGIAASISIPPPRVFGVPFDGFERGLSCEIVRQISWRPSIGGTERGIPIAPAELDEWRVEAELWTSGANAQNLETKVPPYGVPTVTTLELPHRPTGRSLPGLQRASVTTDGLDEYQLPQMTRLESMGRKAVATDLHGYSLGLSLRTTQGGNATNISTAPTTTPPAWLAEKFATRQIQDWSNQSATVTAAGYVAASYSPIQHGRRRDISVALDNLSDDMADELVAFFRGIRHSSAALTLDNGPYGPMSVTVVFKRLSFRRASLNLWDGSMEVSFA